MSAVTSLYQCGTMHSSEVAGLLLTILAVLGHGASEGHEVLLLPPGQDAVLPCLAKTEPGVTYRSIIWYKVSEAPSRQLTGLVMKRLNNGTQNNGSIQRYKGLMRHVELLGDSQSLVLPNVTLQDAGRYLCFLSAPLGRQNKEKEIHLNVFDDERGYEQSDILYEALAISLLIVALLMLYVSYVCLQSALISHKKNFSKSVQLKVTQKMKHLIVRLESKGVVSRILPQEYV